MNKTYFDERIINNTELLKKLRKQLPYICNEFFIGIDTRTSILTQVGYARDLNIFFYFLHTEIEEFVHKDIKSLTFDDLNLITTTHIEMFLNYLSHYKMNGIYHTNTIKTKTRKLSSIKSFFKYNYNKNNIDKDPASKVLTPKIPEKPIIRLESQEVENLLEEVKSGLDLTKREKAFHKITALRDEAILTLFLGTGIRISELVGLDINDIDFNTNSFKITRKGGNQSILYFNDEVKDSLLSYLDERATKPELDNENALFVSLRNTRINVRTVQNLVKKYAHLVTPLKHITPHKLRSTFGTSLYQSTGDIYAVAELLGHKDINTTKKHYAAMSEQIKKEASLKVKLHNNKDDEKI